MRRHFNSSERVALYLASSGVCSLCGVRLEPGWHADHVHPWSAGGPTDIVNGQALCPACNLKKGALMTQGNGDYRYGKYILRAWQQEHLDKSRSFLLSGKRKIVVAPFCGSGKTSANLLAANDAFIDGHIDGLLVLVPRVNLAKQYELDWNSLRRLLPYPTMGPICFRGNNPPLVTSDKQFGVVATYASFASQPWLYFDFVRSRRAGIVFDEAQILGHNTESGDGTKAAKIIRDGCSYKSELFGVSECEQFGPLLELSRFSQIATGTPDRSDGKLLLGGEYSRPDVNGFIHLLPDVSAAYLVGVREQYLRAFEAILCDGHAWKKYVDEHSEQLIISQMNGGASVIIMQPSFWRSVVDITVENVRDVQSVHPRFCGLIAACNQKHAREIKDYLNRKFPALRVGIAISEDPLSGDSLDAFRRGEFDIMVSVMMAYVGFNHPWIRVVCCLSAYRENGFLDQLAGRGLRVIGDIPFDQQVLRWISVADRLMNAWVEKRRTDSEDGMRQKAEAEVNNPPPPPVIAKIVDAQMTDVSVKGMDPSTDLTPAMLSWIEEHKKYAGLEGAEATKIAKLLGKIPDFDLARAASHSSAAPVPAADEPELTDEEWRNHLRSEIKSACNRCDAILSKIDPSVGHGRTYLEIHEVFGVECVPTLGREKLTEVLEWLRSSWLPYCKKLEEVAA
jgi:superfamily II DNA or RNA helicase